MKKGLNLMLTSLFVLSFTAVLGMAGCGGGDLDPTDNYLENGAVDEAACYEACEKVAGCILDNGSEEFAAQNYEDECKLDCNQAGKFESETLICIKKVDNCDDLFECGFEY